MDSSVSCMIMKNLMKFFYRNTGQNHWLCNVDGDLTSTIVVHLSDILLQGFQFLHISVYIFDWSRVTRIKGKEKKS